MATRSPKAPGSRATARRGSATPPAKPDSNTPHQEPKRDKSGRWLKGEPSPNPNGRPKGVGQDVEFRRFLRETLSAPEWREEIISRMHESPQFLMWAADQAFGKAKQAVDLDVSQTTQIVSFEPVASQVGMGEEEFILLLLDHIDGLEAPDGDVH